MDREMLDGIVGAPSALAKSMVQMTISRSAPSSITREAAQEVLSGGFANVLLAVVSQQNISAWIQEVSGVEDVGGLTECVASVSVLTSAVPTKVSV